jgi:hypothetical protein
MILWLQTLRAEPVSAGFDARHLDATIKMVDFFITIPPEIVALYATIALGGSIKPKD